jgi:hypothetical protein
VWQSTDMDLRVEGIDASSVGAYTWMSLVRILSVDGFSLTAMYRAFWFSTDAGPAPTGPSSMTRATKRWNSWTGSCSMCGWPWPRRVHDAEIRRVDRAVLQLLLGPIGELGRSRHHRLPSLVADRAITATPPPLETGMDRPRTRSSPQ